MGANFEFKYGGQPVRIKSGETFQEVQRMDGRLDKLMMPRSLFQKILEICEGVELK